MNLRPPGPQPGALPDCATPRVRRILLRWSVRTRWEHVFVSEEPTSLRSLRTEKPLEEFNWRREGARAARQHAAGRAAPPTTTSTTRQPPAVHRSGAASQAGARRERMLYLLDVLRGAPVRRLRRGRSGRPRVRPHRGQGVQHRARATRTVSGSRSSRRSPSAKWSARTVTGGGPRRARAPPAAPVDESGRPDSNRY